MESYVFIHKKTPFALAERQRAQREPLLKTGCEYKSRRLISHSFVCIYSGIRLVICLVLI